MVHMMAEFMKLQKEKNKEVKLMMEKELDKARRGERGRQDDTGRYMLNVVLHVQGEEAVWKILPKRLMGLTQGKLDRRNCNGKRLDTVHWGR